MNQKQSMNLGDKTKCKRCEGKGYIITYPMNDNDKFIDIHISEALRKKYNLEPLSNCKMIYSVCNICFGLKELDWVENIIGLDIIDQIENKNNEMESFFKILESHKPTDEDINHYYRT